MTISPVLNVWQPASMLFELCFLNRKLQNSIKILYSFGMFCFVTHLHLHFYRQSVMMLPYCYCLDYGSYCVDCLFEFCYFDNSSIYIFQMIKLENKNFNWKTTFLGQIKGTYRFGSVFPNWKLSYELLELDCVSEFIFGSVVMT